MRVNEEVSTIDSFTGEFVQMPEVNATLESESEWDEGNYVAAMVTYPFITRLSGVVIETSELPVKVRKDTERCREVEDS